ncbi:hypothetical protein AAFF_G00437370 [Aldrovandia affinis]|uniref:Uncharacterized protein n=1 Tax=Aldrovandia affinis TaxID=143900 RepID=A0AAD7S9X2_9TELE|nr:hypothetical protein AAFF_G00437370 [Aldrovandia affinis]
MEALSFAEKGIRVVDSIKLTDPNSQSGSITDSKKCLSPAASVEDMKTESVMDSTDYTGEEPRSSLNRSEDLEERLEGETRYGMNREEKRILSNIKEEEEEGGEREDGVRDEEGLWRQKEKQRNEQKEKYVTDQIILYKRWRKNEGKSECGQQEGEELARLVNSCLLNQPRVLIRRCEITDISFFVSTPPHSVPSKQGQRVSSPWRRHELSAVKRKRSLKGQVITRKKKTIDQLVRKLKRLPASSENG